VRQENIRTLLNFFPVIGEDAEGRMIELDAAQVLTFPQVFKAREVVRRGFLSNLLFANVAGIFRYSEHVKEILDKLPTAKQGKLKDWESRSRSRSHRRSPTATATSKSTSRRSSTRRSS
jgi:type II restriction enzyme